MPSEHNRPALTRNTRWSWPDAVQPSKDFNKIPGNPNKSKTIQILTKEANQIEIVVMVDDTVTAGDLCLRCFEFLHNPDPMMNVLPTTHPLAGSLGEEILCLFAGLSGLTGGDELHSTYSVTLCSMPTYVRITKFAGTSLKSATGQNSFCC
ncbi:unnamed protein product [Hermetia illucens]|uniref:Uncharacterized protein n=1 Tax=Hermetia illucens TaxID=343691 RepID=A0A7R8YT96_HERIL|nr:unnamed protein product [Hermetia illucens]